LLQGLGGRFSELENEKHDLLAARRSFYDIVVPSFSSPQPIVGGRDHF
jgi:hypothetical protein